MKPISVPINFLFLLVLSFAVAARSPGAPAPRNDAGVKPSGPQTAASPEKAGEARSVSAAPERKKSAPRNEVKVIRTTHLVTLTNGEKIRCDFIEEKGKSIVFALKPYGSFAIAKERIASMRKEPGEITLKLTPKKKPVARTTKKRKAPGSLRSKEPSIEERLTPPPVPLEKIPEINYWLYQLTRQDHKWRVRAETHLKAMGDIVAGPVIPYTGWTHWLVRAAALRILASTGHPSVVPYLFEALGDPEPVVREVAYRALRKVTGKRIPFDPRGSPGARRRGIRRWETYLKDAGLLIPQEPKEKNS